MKELPFYPIDIDLAFFMAQKMGKLNNSITEGKGNVAGLLGEIVLARYLNVNLDFARQGDDLYNYDLKYKGKTIDVKTKRRLFDPEEDWEVSVAQTSAHQKNDVYVFISMTFGDKIDGKYKNLKRIWLCGGYERKKYFEDSKLIKKGQILENGFVTKQNMYNLSINKLKIV